MSDDQECEMTKEGWIFIGVGIVVAVIALGVLLFCCCRKRGSTWENLLPLMFIGKQDPPPPAYSQPPPAYPAPPSYYPANELDKKNDDWAV